MFYAMAFYPTGYNKNVTCRAVRTAPYRSLEEAVAALLKVGQEGYVKQEGITKPVWNNVSVQ